ncbi:MAG TPA: PilN domain-containing protein [bacterium]|nr:PilN domain-containing protein [bacterium]
MITINLLAPGRRRPIGPAPGVMLAFLATAAVVGLLIVVTIFLGTRLGALHRQLNDVNKKMEALRPIAQEVDRLEQTLRRLQDRQTVLRALLSRQLPATDSLRALRTVIPQDVWLIDLATSGARGVVFDGYTFTYRSVARFMVALKDSDRFRNIDLTSTQKEKIGERDVVKFQVTGELAPMSAGGSNSLPGLAVTSPGGGASGNPSAPPGGTQPTRLVVQKTGEVQ